MTEYGRIHTDGSRSGGQPVIKTQHCPNCEAQAAEIERLRVEAQAQFDRGYYDGCTRQPTQSDALRIKLLEDALVAVVEATRAYLPPDGIDAKECLSRILEATDNSTINPVIFEIEDRAALQEK
jgi:hypothetical protein